MYKWCWLFVVISPIGLIAQVFNLASVDYTILPAGESDFEYNGIRVSLNYPIKLNERDYMFLGGRYANANLIFGSEPRPFDKKEIDGFQILDLNFGYLKRLKNDWLVLSRFSPGLSSNLTAKDLTINDFVISADVVFILNRKENPKGKPFRLIFGVSYSENRGFPYPLPFLSYYRKFHPKWSYNFGVPKTNLQFHASERHRFKLTAELDGFTSNLQNGTLLDDGQVAESINASLILGGLKYEYHFLKRFELYAKASYILNKRVQLRDGNQENIFLLDDANGFYLRVGVELKVN
ncbi:hypothetical protein J8281_02480 [Aquimarina sp. U1-2]|uniref:DUF6268 family outer membrane beta-barrel protein n=1 Tax=Aquimarina sp. U1-2 TaxID=2823141 RepID=UPI001AECE388|nr:DUF6268 family outer membrane beta-barrel protein [Aquimarina sp. U1-2]MBP2831042.1 hypothetical protein [Aquimarina sp. U1-2]